MTPDRAFKLALVREITLSLERDLDVLKASALAATQAATHEESKAEDKYDTRGLEASYLAGAQARRAGELQKLIQEYRFLEIRNFDSSGAVAVTALVQYESDDKASWLFLVPRGGGQIIELQGMRVAVVSPVSNLGQEIVGRRVDEEFEFEAGGRKRECRVMQIV